MPSLDLNNSYSDIQSKLNATKSYVKLKNDYKDAKKKAGDSYEKSKKKLNQRLSSLKTKKDKLTTSINDAKTKANKYQTEIKNQFEQLLDLGKLISNDSDGNSVAYIKRKLIETLKIIQPEILKILLEESIKAVGCDQNQIYTPQQKVYIKVKSIDLSGLLFLDPNEKKNKPLYEKSAINPTSRPFSMNRELQHRIQEANDYNTEYGQNYVGASGQDLFNIKFVETNPTTNESGGWFEVTLSGRNNTNIKEYIVDYYQSIKLFENATVMSWIMETLTGAVSINTAGDFQVNDMSEFLIFLQRIFGLCVDNRSEIDVSGNAKVSETDNFDESFFTLNEIDLRQINQRNDNIRNKVAEFESCDDIKIPVNVEGIFEDLERIIDVPDSDFVDQASKLTDNVITDEAKKGLGFDLNLDTDFIQSMFKGLLLSLFSPKVILPLFIMKESIDQNSTQKVESFKSFIKQNATYFKNVSTKIGGIFIKTLFEIIKKDIVTLIQNVLSDIAKEKINLKLKRILKLIQLLLIVANLVQDWRSCKSVIDELFALLNLARGGFGNNIPLPILFASELLDGYSQTRAFIGAIEEMESLGIPTGPMPDGSPNLTVLSVFSQMTAMSNEEAENGKVQIAVGPLTITPAGFTIPSNAFGKKI